MSNTAERRQGVKAPSRKKQQPDNHGNASGTSALAEDHLLRLSELELAKLLRFEAEIRFFNAELTHVSSARKAFLEAIDPENKLQQFGEQLKGLAENALHSRRAYDEVRRKAGERLGVDLSQFSFDDTDGILHPTTK